MYGHKHLSQLLTSLVQVFGDGRQLLWVGDHFGQISHRQQCRVVNWCIVVARKDAGTNVNVGCQTSSAQSYATAGEGAVMNELSLEQSSSCCVCLSNLSCM